MFRAAKNALASKAAQVYLKGLLARYGEVEEVKIDSENQTISLTVHLKGEATSITAQVGHYEIHQVGAKKFIEISKCRCSRAWMQALMEDFTAGRRIELPPLAAAAL